MGKDKKSAKNFTQKTQKEFPAQSKSADYAKYYKPRPKLFPKTLNFLKIANFVCPPRSGINKPKYTKNMAYVYGSFFESARKTTLHFLKYFLCIKIRSGKFENNLRKIISAKHESLNTD